MLKTMTALAFFANVFFLKILLKAFFFNSPFLLSTSVFNFLFVRPALEYSGEVWIPSSDLVNCLEKVQPSYKRSFLFRTGHSRLLHSESLSMLHSFKNFRVFFPKRVNGNRELETVNLCGSCAVDRFSSHSHELKIINLQYQRIFYFYMCVLTEAANKIEKKTGKKSYFFWLEFFFFTYPGSFHGVLYKHNLNDFS